MLLKSEQSSNSSLRRNLDLAVRGGGHSTAGSNKKTVKVGGGAIGGEVDAGLAKHGLATIGGTISDTGDGGLTLGGGYGWLTGKHGLMSDNLLSVTIVLANGEITNASKEENPDLFWAVRGAGHNFGIVTEFVFQVFEQGGMWAGILAFRPAPPIVEKVVAVRQ